MRALIAATILLATGAWTTGSRRAPIVEDPGLTAAQVEHYSAAYTPVIRACYAESANGIAAATGKLDLSLQVLRDGTALVLEVKAPGLPIGRLRALDACIRTEVDTWHFPVGRYDTEVHIPYWFHRVYVPGAGPAYSCWDPNGCRKPEKRG